MSEQDEDFAALFEASIKTNRFQTGQHVEGTIVAIGPEVAFVNVGAKGEAMIAIDELKDADGALEARVGDRIAATVVSTAGGLTLSRKLARDADLVARLHRPVHFAFDRKARPVRILQLTRRGSPALQLARQRQPARLAHRRRQRGLNPVANTDL